MRATSDDLPEILASDLPRRRALVQAWNEAYRTGEALVSDELFDAVLESLPQDDPLRGETGFEVSDQRKTPLPIPMFSMDKVKSLDEIDRWKSSKSIGDHERVVVTPKYDGLSFLVHGGSGRAFTRGNGVEGQSSDLHFARLRGPAGWAVPDALKNRHLIGEVIMPRATFEEKYAADFRNPRNLVAGLFNAKEAGEALADVHFLAYGLGEEEEDKSEQLKLLDSVNSAPLPRWEGTLGELGEERLQELFGEWGKLYEIDGLIVELESATRRKELGREKNNNPSFARAWKGFEAMSASTTIEEVRFQVSKDGRLAPVGQVEPVELDGVTVSNVTLNNAGMMKLHGWWKGSKVKIIRSGMVIPKIIETLEGVDPRLPVQCPQCDSELKWDANEVHLKCLNRQGCTSQRIQGAVAFFKTLEIEEVGQKVVELFFESGHDSIEKILHLSVEDLMQLDRFAQRRAELVHANVHEKLRDVELEKLQHASGCFEGLGTKRLALVRNFRDPEAQPPLEELLAIHGFSELTAQAYLKGWKPFWDFFSRIPATLADAGEAEAVEGGRCEGMRLCFTGFRDKGLQKSVEANGGEVLSGVSGKTTHLVCKDPTGQSSKIKKARDLGCEIWSVDQLRSFLE